MKHIKIIIQYDGTGYSGWQIQKTDTTVQGVLEDAVFSVTAERSRVTGAGRTDAGVHAVEQVAVFHTASGIEPAVFRQALNAHLPDDIRVVHSEECPADFHPRYGAKGKTYSYLISCTGPFSVFLKRYSWQMHKQPDHDAMKKAAAYLIGEHDFSSFRASGCSSSHPVRNITDITISKTGSVEFIALRFNTPVIKISIQANAFLRHMARNIAGTLVDVGSGKYAPEKMREVLEAKDRRAAGRTAPACGLFLEKIEY